MTNKQYFDLYVEKQNNYRNNYLKNRQRIINKYKVNFDINFVYWEFIYCESVDYPKLIDDIDINKWDIF